MAMTRKEYSPNFKAKVAVEAICGERTLRPRLASQFRVHPVQIGQWRKAALARLADVLMDSFGRGQDALIPRASQAGIRYGLSCCERETPFRFGLGR